MEPTTFRGTLARPEQVYMILPRIRWKHREPSQSRQQLPVNVVFRVRSTRAGAAISAAAPCRHPSQLAFSPAAPHRSPVGALGVGPAHRPDDPMSEVNSREYWNTRFETDWTTRSGCEQSRFFASVILRLLPSWLVRVLRDGASVCDFGCAMGDGTAVLAGALAGARFTGVDFSATAIERARRGHPGLDFACRDLLQEPAGEGFDVLLSSNVLEHFQSPRQVLATLAGHSRRLMVHLVPFREPLAARDPEHLAAFDWDDLVLEPLPGWRLVHAAVIDAARLAGSLWAGEQVLLVHARDEEAARLGLSLAEVRFDSLAAAEASAEVARKLAEAAQRELKTAIDAMTATHRAEIEAKISTLFTQLEALTAACRAQADASVTIHSLTGQLDDRRAEVARLANELEAARRQAAALQDQLNAARTDLTAILASRIWRWTSPLRRAANRRR
jgi:SAM-dependent methyltransferase